MEIVKELTKNCERIDCKITSKSSMTTLLGGSMGYYDKEGVWYDTDPNTRTTVYECLSCNKQWSIKTRDGIEPVIEEL